ncbi:1-(5-phosphoribosyl)-5-[(5-phosphoribosylamino)methylideneamino] imidazole-4-carboxamide isomerase [Phaeobacter gallaeciensis]|uniref:1-(5-phosphoribosyl)-5-[(5-phosphoribosylamino)methylideneamino] imidazole-4-carboxamide isomerase n=2 Tax=Roseobacteraceae TaxID=2854170 RepID=A0A366WR42_9RHOB|nr:MULTISPECIES: 1-(5-phosphoribosyl)-5-[(5-phosphoribosylamino)methylideneamino] imidazole-4-carboxamide isomerase [Roseobacteraceae]MBT3140738.1 1-(5-phosphoribosyl)-5-[(5-phosphoribosylamino)methylideneamino] imidazole-4-carboxamide isomerase [Falsiruegeria litorea]MBT8170482.1 1-(5-phosphoribosyl)-5-[(5-phosphoribosylamino)methylideneamino] imidazole-4-carboxamide isomerase [Falsiruegeria litorea]RBW52698.1 1-(5-phosphoribosyl)-5-[(5-phosphoribosylamino)methylideneamino] imidazole-4-carboxam
MMIYPTMELQKGRCVTLDKGRLDSAMLWHVDPVETARGFAAAGAEWMHITDFDAIEGEDGNAELIEEIIRSAGIPVQLGGGMRSREAIEHWIDKGVGRVVVGTLAARDPELIKELAKHHPDQIVLAVDVWQGQVMTEGWRSSSAFTPEAFIEAFSDAPFAAIIVTDIDSDMEDVEAQLGLIAGVAEKAKSPVVASGVVRSVDDISRLTYIPNIAGVLVGRALYRKTVDLAEALAVAQPGPEPVAELQ